MAEWLIEELGDTHERGGFCCGKPPLDDFLQRHSGQATRNRTGRTYVATRPGEKRVLGFYTSATGSFRVDVLPPEKRKKLAKHPVPTVHLGRMAVDKSCQGQGLGEKLLFHFLKKALDVSREVGVHAVDVFAKDDDARTFYAKYGFIELLDDRFHLYLPIVTVERMFASAAADPVEKPDPPSPSS